MRRMFIPALVALFLIITSMGFGTTVQAAPTDTYVQKADLGTGVVYQDETPGNSISVGNVYPGASVVIDGGDVTNSTNVDVDQSTTVVNPDVCYAYDQYGNPYSYYC